MPIELSCLSVPDDDWRSSYGLNTDRRFATRFNLQKSCLYLVVASWMILALECALRDIAEANSILITPNYRYQISCNRLVELACSRQALRSLGLTERRLQNEIKFRMSAQKDFRSDFDVVVGVAGNESGFFGEKSDPAASL